MNKTIVKPKTSELLYENLFTRRDSAATIELLSKGLCACTRNAELLLKDAELLISAKSYARAQFLIATADEEMAKAYQLLDMCRLKFDNQENYLRQLCHAFYGHVEKHAYNKVYRSYARDIAHAKEIFHSALKLWWPSGDIESGEPDMPHVTHFSRELPLYVDYIDFDQNWWVPTDNVNIAILEFGLVDNSFLNSRCALEHLICSQNLGFFAPDVLNILNDIFKNHVITEKTTNEELFVLYDKVAKKIKKLLGTPSEKVKESILMSWPLYHFLQSGPRKTGRVKK